MINTIFNPIQRLAHGWQVLSAMLLAGSFTAVAYGLSEAGLAGAAGTALSFFLVFVGTRLFSKLAVAKRGGHFEGTKTMAAQVKTDIDAWMLDRSTLSIFVLAVPASIAYVALRALCIFLLGIFGNLWIALSGGLLLGAVVASPVLFRDLGRLANRSASQDPSEATEGN